MSGSRWTEQDLARLSQRNGSLRKQQAQAVVKSHAKFKAPAAFDPFLELLRAHGLPLPNPATKHGPGREFVFARPRLWRADYHWLTPRKLIVEREGGLFGGGAGGSLAVGGHSNGTGAVRDMEKANAAQLLGYIYLRFQPCDLDSGKALTFIRQALQS